MTGRVEEWKGGRKSGNVGIMEGWNGGRAWKDGWGLER